LFQFPFRHLHLESGTLGLDRRVQRSPALPLPAYVLNSELNQTDAHADPCNGYVARCHLRLWNRAEQQPGDDRPTGEVHFDRELQVVLQARLYAAFDLGGDKAVGDDEGDRETKAYRESRHPASEKP
jgi:hypothetical protein